MRKYPHGTYTSPNGLSVEEIRAYLQEYMVCAELSGFSELEEKTRQDFTALGKPIPPNRPVYFPEMMEYALREDERSFYKAQEAEERRIKAARENIKRLRPGEEGLAL